MSDRAEAWSKTFLDRWLSLGASGLILVQLGLWVPHYLTWPYWADHDVFASAARAWTEGGLPYRDVRLNNFPGTIYLFWILGKLVGWGRPRAFYAFDVGLLLTFGAMLTFWSRRRFGRAWPGLLGFLVWLSTALSLDYTHAAQRDWHAPAFAVLALLVSQTFPGMAGLVVSAFLAAVGFSIRPQVILLGPALVASAGWLNGSRTPTRAAIRGTLWVGASTGFVILLFLPLILSGVLGDFLGSLRLVAPGSAYNQLNGLAMAKRWTVQASELHWWAIAVSLVVILPGRGSALRRLGLVWLLALAGVSLYQPISPFPHSYLEIPLAVVGACVLTVVLGFLADERVGPASLRMVAVLGLAAMGGTTVRPDFSEFGPTIRAIRSAVTQTPDPTAPPGYRHGSIPSAAYYPWADYRATLDYLRTRTSPSTRVASLLKGDPAVVSMVGRASALPAESITWLRMVRPEDEHAFAAQLDRESDSVVVWIPNEVGPHPKFRIDELARLVRQRYEFAERFGSIEVWVRKTRRDDQARDRNQFALSPWAHGFGRFRSVVIPSSPCSFIQASRSPRRVARMAEWAGSAARLCCSQGSAARLYNSSAGRWW